MAAATLTYGESLAIGGDVIPKRFFGNIYNSTAGIEDITVKLATSTDPVVEPLIGEFTTAIVDISSNEVSHERTVYNQIMKLREDIIKFETEESKNNQLFNTTNNLYFNESSSTTTSSSTNDDMEFNYTN